MKTLSFLVLYTMYLVPVWGLSIVSNMDVRNTSEGLYVLGPNPKGNILTGEVLRFASSFHYVYVESGAGWVFETAKPRSEIDLFIGPGYGQDVHDAATFCFALVFFNGSDLKFRAFRTGELRPPWETNLMLHYQLLNSSAGFYESDVLTYKKCPAGFFCPDDSQPILCPAGYFCPLQSAVGFANPCPAGSYCPLGSQSPLACPDGFFGAKQNFIDPSNCSNCAPGYYCDSGSITPYQFVCPGGFFCPNGFRVYCNGGYYCPEGSRAKLPCPQNYSCASGSSSPVSCPGYTSSSPESASCSVPVCPDLSSCAQLSSWCPIGITSCNVETVHGVMSGKYTCHVCQNGGASICPNPPCSSGGGSEFISTGAGIAVIVISSVFATIGIIFLVRWYFQSSDPLFQSTSSAPYHSV